MEHRDVTRREFARQVAEFERPDSFFGDQDVLDWIAAHVPVAATDGVLDVAGGAGHVGRHLAARAAFAVVVDLTPEMLAAGVAAVSGDGRRNVVFVLGDATALPFADAQFDVVVSRFAFHHIDEPPRAAAEMARVARPGGTVAVIDMVSDLGEPGARHNELERLRDPSHTRALEEAELLAALAAAGVDAAIRAERRQRLPALPWLERAASADAPRERIVAALEAEAAGGAATGLHAARREPATGAAPAPGGAATGPHATRRESATGAAPAPGGAATGPHATRRESATGAAPAPGGAATGPHATRPESGTSARVPGEALTVEQRWVIASGPRR